MNIKEKTKNIKIAEKTKNRKITEKTKNRKIPEKTKNRKITEITKNTTKQKQIFNRLNAVYHNPKDPGSLGGLARLARRASELGITKNKKIIKEYLQTQRAYSFHKPAQKRYTRNKTIVYGIDSQWQADLADMQALASENNGIKYLLTCIDVFSKFAWVIPVKDKSAKTMLEALDHLLHQSAPRKPKKLQTDKGTEFLNKQFQNKLKTQYGIEHFTTMGETKAAIVERFNRTLKERIWHYFTSSKSKEYFSVLQDIVDAYNHSMHRSIKMRPVDVKKSNENLVWRRLYGNGAKNPCSKTGSKTKTGDTVRIAKWKGDFAKGYEPNWTEEEFKVMQTDDKQCPRRVYKLADSLGEPILGSFYSSQVQKVKPSKDYVIEKVIQTRVDSKTKTKELLVKWEGWPEKFNSWIPESNLNNE